MPYPVRCMSPGPSCGRRPSTRIPPLPSSAVSAVGASVGVESPRVSTVGASRRQSVGLSRAVRVSSPISIPPFRRLNHPAPSKREPPPTVVPSPQESESARPRPSKPMSPNCQPRPTVSVRTRSESAWTARPNTGARPPDEEKVPVTRGAS